MLLPPTKYQRSNQVIPPTTLHAFILLSTTMAALIDKHLGHAVFSKNGLGFFSCAFETPVALNYPFLALITITSILCHQLRPLRFPFPPFSPPYTPRVPLFHQFSLFTSNMERIPQTIGTAHSVS